jgi:hypothetical protein
MAMLATGVFFIAGLAVLMGIDPERGRKAAAAADGCAQASVCPGGV